MLRWHRARKIDDEPFDARWIQLVIKHGDDERHRIRLVLRT